MSGPRTLLVIPCYNEAARLDTDAYLAFAEVEPELGYLFVDDGSTDDTAAVITKLVARLPGRASLVQLPFNMGKAEAVRHGMLAGLHAEPSYLGFWDADLSAPLHELSDFIDALEVDPACLIVLGARVRLLGRTVDRRSWRHYPGRFFATAASASLGVPIYDVLCGAKLLRVGPTTDRLFAAPFLSRWAFDVELLARFFQLYGPDAVAHIVELPLQQWCHREGSKVRAIDLPRSLWDLLRIQHHYGGRTWAR